MEVYHQCQQSPNVLHMVEFFETDNKFYLVFELIRGGMFFFFFLYTHSHHQHPLTITHMSETQK